MYRSYHHHVSWARMKFSSVISKNLNNWDPSFKFNCFYSLYYNMYTSLSQWKHISMSLEHFCFIVPVSIPQDVFLSSWIIVRSCFLNYRQAINIVDVKIVILLYMLLTYATFLTSHLKRHKDIPDTEVPVIKISRNRCPSYYRSSKIILLRR